MGKRIAVFKNFIRILLVIGLLVAVAYGYQNFDKIIEESMIFVDNYVAMINGMFFQEWITGITVGTGVFIIILIIFPILMRNINTRSYFRDLYEGLISTFIYFITQSIYDFFAETSRFYLIVSIIGLTIITLVLVNVVAKLYKNKEAQMDFRSGYIASITAGLIFGVLVQLFDLGFEIAKSQIASVFHFFS